MDRSVYWDAVRETAYDTLKYAVQGVEEQTYSDLDEALSEQLWSELDTHEWVMDRRESIAVLSHSNYESAYLDNYGADGLVEGSLIRWDRLAYAAMEADVQEELHELQDRAGANDYSVSSEQRVLILRKWLDEQEAASIGPNLAADHNPYPGDLSSEG